MSICGLPDEARVGMKLESPAFKQGGMIPQKYTCDAGDASPPLSWSEVPPGAVSLCLIVDDPDAPILTWVHWVMYNIPPGVPGLKEGLSARDAAESGMTQGTNSWRRTGYGGPCPPGHSTHRYFFKLYAVDKNLEIKPGASKRDLEKAMSGHVLEEAQLVGVYSRK